MFCASISVRTAMCNTIATMKLKKLTETEGKRMNIKQPLTQRKTLNALIFLCQIIFIVNSASAENRIIYYRDGALFQQEAVAARGIIELPLADGLLEKSLKIIPATGTSILEVEVRKSAARSKSERELENLLEQRRRFEDRLQALATREEIFKAAAKSQGGKAPRKTKANPDPLQAIRQGTDFAIAQLEAVYTSRRKSEQEILNIDERIAAIRKRGGQAERSVHVSVTPARGRVTLHYATSARGWQPQYTLHLTGDGSATLELSAKTVADAGGFRAMVSPGSINDSIAATVLPFQTGSRTSLTSYRFPLADEHFDGGIFNQFSGRITNTNSNYLPPGDSTLFRNGTYLGKFRFDGLSSGRSAVISSGAY